MGMVHGPHVPERRQGLKHVGIIIVDGVILADVVGIAEVFAAGDKMVSSLFMGTAGYRISLLSLSGGMVMSSSAVQVMTSPLPSAVEPGFESLIIASGSGNFDAYRDPRLISWLQDAQMSVRRMAALCTGVFVLGAAGLLDNRRTATHWALKDKLQQEFPGTIIETELPIAQDGNVFTANDAGLGAELALCLLEQDLGSVLARRIAQTVVSRPHPHERAHIHLQPHEHEHEHRSESALRGDRIQKAQRWLEENLAAPISMLDAAMSVSMSERNFQREFKRETGQTPHTFLLKLRLDAVRRYLRDTDLPVEKIARRCGFFSGEHVSKLFRKYLGVSPCEYRKSERAPPTIEPAEDIAQHDVTLCCRTER